MPSSTAAAAIETIGLTKTYGHNRGIRDVSMRIERGEIFGFLGPNGAGKSTTLRTILGFLRPTSGHATVLGLDSQRETVAIHRRIGNLPSEFSLEDRMTGAEMLRFFADLRSAQDHLPYAHQLAERLDADLTRPMRRLSRGNKQKMGIIQALFSHPEVIILDEPTSGLDPLVQEEFLTILSEHRDAGATLFFSSHILSEVERLADRVGIIRNGELVAIEQPSALTERAFRYVRIQFTLPLDSASIRAFEQAPGVQKFAVEDGGHRLTFQAHGGMDAIVKLAGDHQVAMFDAERPPLEELFLTYYA